jgi:hypothetical protein
VGGRCSQRPGPSPTLGSLGPSHHRRQKSRVSLRGPPCAHGVLDILFREVRNTHPHHDHLVPLTNGATSPGCHSRILLVSMVLRALLMETCATLTPPNGVDAFIDFICSWAHQFSICHPLLVWHCVYIRVVPPQCIFKFGKVSKVSFLGGPFRKTLDFLSKDLNYTRLTYFEIYLGDPCFQGSQARLH